jgi:hypothetical protein
MVTLTTAQKRRFKRNGFLVLEDGIDEGLCAEAREVLWETIPEDRDDPGSWFARDGDHDEILNRTSGSDSSARFTRVEPFEVMFRRVYDYAEELVGEDELAAPDERPAEYCLHGGHLLASREDGTQAVDHDGAIGPILQYPSDVRDDAHEPFDYRERWHVDGGTGLYATEDDDVEYLPFTVACAVYFDEVEPRGGGFTVWPRSHRLTEEYFASHSYGDLDGDVLHDLDPGPAFEITGGPGTLVLWHHNVIHGAAPNHSERIRMAGFQRIAHRDIARIGQAGLSDVWKMYPAIRDVQPVHHDPY